MFGCRQLTPPTPTPQSPSSALEGGPSPEEQLVVLQWARSGLGGQEGSGQWLWG